MYPKHFLDYFREFETTDEVFVAMPFGEEAAERRWEEIFAPAIEAVDLEPYRVDTRDVGDSILTDILEGIGRARLVLGDVSGQGVTELGDDRVRRPNPNAVYELGIAHAVRLETEVVVVRAEPEEGEEERVPFDLLHIRHHTFDPRDAEAAAHFVARLLSGALEEIDRTQDLIVERTIRRLDAEARLHLAAHVMAGGALGGPPDHAAGRGAAGLLLAKSSQNRRRDITCRLTQLGLLKANFEGADLPGTYQVTMLGYAVADRLEIDEP